MRRVSAATLRTLERVEARLDAPDEVGGGVMRVPPIMSLDAWEALAVPSQQKLVRDSHEDVERRHADQVSFKHPMPAPVVNGQRTHTPDPHRAQEARPMPPRPPMGLTR